jgi:hypothetical protein
MSPAESHFMAEPALPLTSFNYSRPTHVGWQRLLSLLTTSATSSSLVGVDLLAILVEPDPRGWCAVAAALAGANTHDLAVDGAGDAVLELEVHFGNGVVGEDGGIGDIT